MLENEKFKNDLYFILRDVKNSKKARVYNRLCSFLEKAYDIIITKYTSWQWEKFGTNNGVEISASETEKKSVEHIRDILVSDKLRELYSELLNCQMFYSPQFYSLFRGYSQFICQLLKIL